METSTGACVELIVGAVRGWASADRGTAGVRSLTFVSPQNASGSDAQDPRVILVHDVDRPRSGLVAPDAPMMKRVLRIGAEPASRLYIACFAGVSRSPAAAYAIACMHAGPGREDRLAQTLRRVCPSATPNALMVALADDLLGRGGRMIAAIAAIGRGAEAFEGERFAWTLATGEAHRLAEAPSSPAASATCSTPPSTSPV